jgi:hypothetical protein
MYPPQTWLSSCKKNIKLSNNEFNFIIIIVDVWNHNELMN